MNTDLVPQLLMVIFLILTIYLLVIITENMMDVDTLWNLGYFHLKVWTSYCKLIHLTVNCYTVELDTSTLW
jgi:hypothetical protein